MNRNLQAKNRAPAPIQITAEQILREARDRGLEEAPKPPKQFITDRDELAAYQLKKRKEFEDGVFRNKKNLGRWVLYGQWEAEQKEFERSRSVFERAIDVDYRNEFVWTKYAEMEMKNKFINHARNIWDRCVTLLPRNDSLWLKYTYMEELAGCVAAARAVFERFMAWEPNDLGWAAFIKFEQRQGETSRVRGVYERYVACHPTAVAFLKFAKWEEGCRQLGHARAVYERAIEGGVHASQRTLELVVSFARFEERCKEQDRARAILHFALRHIAAEPNEVEALNHELVAFEKRHGAREEIEDAILSKRRAAYEAAVSADRFDYDSWLDLARLEEAVFEECAVAAAADRQGVLQEVDLRNLFASSSGGGGRPARQPCTPHCCAPGTPTRGPSHKSRFPARNGSGGDTFIYGSATRCLRSSQSKTGRGRARSTRPAWRWCLIKSSHSPKYGCRPPFWRCDAKTWHQRANSWGRL